jgi:DNA-binding MarR family transcriptional regulator
MARLWRSQEIGCLRAARMMTTPEEARILDALAMRKYSSHDLQAITGLRAATFYPAVMRLEQVGRVRSEFEPGPYPRRRIYEYGSVAEGLSA